MQITMCRFFIVYERLTKKFIFALCSAPALVELQVISRHD